MAPPAFTLKSYEFRREREAAWADLEELVTRLEQRGVRALDSADLHRLPALYRSALSSLATARSISLDKNVVHYLEGLSARAYVFVYGTRTPFRETIGAFFFHTFPALVEKRRRELALACALLVLGTVAGFFLTLENPSRFYSFVDAGMAGGRSPSSSRDELLKVLHDHGGAADTLTGFATFLFTHNAKIGLLCFAVGFLAGVPVMALLFINGLTLGAMAAIYAEKGLSLEFWLWILPHGVTELLAIALCAAAGFTVGERVVFPGKHSRIEGLAIAGREASAIAVGAVALFFVAALIEGFFRQLVHEPFVRAGVAIATTLFWTYLFGVRKGKPT